MPTMIGLKLVVVLWLLGVSTGDKNHTISKRSLLFPRATVLQFTYGISAPLILPKRSINLSLCLQVNYDLPYNLTNFQTRIVEAKSSDSFDVSREVFYRYIIGFLDSFGLNGERCLLRLICEISEYPVHLGHKENLLEEIAHFIFTPSLELGNGANSTFAGKLLEAEELGGKGGCRREFSDCFVPIVDLFTAKFLIN